MSVHALVGTPMGLLLLTGYHDRLSWRTDGPVLESGRCSTQEWTCAARRKRPADE